MASIALKPCYYLDTWTTAPVVSMSSTGTEFADTLASVTMGFLDTTDVEALTLTEASGITITSSAANAWAVTVDSRSMTLTPKTWRWYMTFTDSAGIIQTRLTGTLEVKKK